MTDKPFPLTTVDELAKAGLVDTADMSRLRHVAKDFRIRITPAMQKTSPGVAAQFVPNPQELMVRPEELTDPIGDLTYSPVPGLTHRYPDRAILHVTQTCHVYCRFCFRRETVGTTGPLPHDQLATAFEYITKTPALRELILTGGDPMTLSPRRMSAIISRIDAIPHIEIIRLHSRTPIVSPESIPALLPLLRCRAAMFLVIHINHPDELTSEARDAIASLAGAGVVLLSQSVLLRGINDNVGTLAQLFRALTALRITPYYLHHCDLARGTSHFRTTIKEGLALMTALRGNLSGVAIPRYVLDLPGGFGKVTLDSDAVSEDGPGRWRIRDWKGNIHDYQDISR